jgi:hypothetical protein
MTHLSRLLLILIVSFTFLLALAGQSFADDIIVPAPEIKIESPDKRPRTIKIIIKDHRFEPSQLTLFPQEKVILRIINKDASAEEFESKYLKREKLIPGNSYVDIAIGPLKPGVYDFMGEFHSDTAQGRITVPQLGWNYNNQQ